MLNRNTLLATAAALALTSVPASAEGFDFGIAARDFLLRVSAHDDDHRGDHYRHDSYRRDSYRRDSYRRDRYRASAHQRHSRSHHGSHGRQWVEGHYDTQTVRKWVEGYYETVHVPAVYRTEQYYDFCGYLQTRSVLVKPACTERVWRPGYWTTETVRTWVPGCWVNH